MTKTGIYETYFKSLNERHFGNRPAKQVVEEALSTLDQYDREMVDLYYGNCYTQQQIADVYGISQSTLRSWVNKYLLKARNRWIKIQRETA